MQREIKAYICHWHELNQTLGFYQWSDFVEDSDPVLPVDSPKEYMDEFYTSLLPFPAQK